MYMYSKERKDAMWKISLAVSEYMLNDIALTRKHAIEKYLEEIRYPGMNISYRRKFVEMSLAKYPPAAEYQSSKLFD
jgi:hypothetical protein